MQDPVPDYTSAGTPMTRGICPVCGTKLSKFGRTPEHDLIPKPETEKPTAKKAAKTKTTAKKHVLFFINPPVLTPDYPVVRLYSLEYTLCLFPRHGNN